MKDLRQALLGILAALISAFLILGSLALALTEGRNPLAQLPSVSPSLPITLPRETPSQGISAPTPLAATPTSPIPATLVTVSCPIIPGWQTIDILPGDTFASLAQMAGISEQELRQANCMPIGDLMPGFQIIIPPSSPTPTTPEFTPTTSHRTTSSRPVSKCPNPPASWVTYVVQPGDTLYSLARATDTTVEYLKAVNCLSSNLIRVRQVLYIPHSLPTRTPLPTSTSVRTATMTQPAPTSSPSNTPVPSGTPSPTDTPLPSNTPAPTNTPIPSNTPTLEPTPTPT